MTAVRRLVDYPEEYTELFKKAHKKPVKISFETKRKAIVFRVELYNFRTAHRRAAVDDPEAATTLLFLEQIMLSVQDTNLVLTKKEPKHVKRIREALDS